MLFDRARVASALPGYDLGDEIGAGAFGLVLAGWHRRLQRDVAIKVLPARGPQRASGGRTEAPILASLDHPHIVRVYDYLETDNLDLIVMEMLDGGSLAQRQEGMSQEQACATGLAVAGALSYAHSRGVLHRDIKPDNVLFDAAGLVKVADFGIAKRLNVVAATASVVAGTPLFMAPEQLARGRLGPGTDLYALGTMLSLLLTGTTPFDPDPPPEPTAWEGSSDPFGRRLRRLVGVPARVGDVVLRTLAGSLAARPSSARTFALDLAEAAAAAYGPGWLTRAGISVWLDDDVRAAAEHTAASPAASANAARGPASVPTPASAATAAITSTSAPLPTRGTSPTAATGVRVTQPGRRSWAARPASRRHRPRRLTQRLAVITVVTVLAVAGGLLAAAATQRSAEARPHPLGLPLTGHTDWVTAVAFSPDAHALASASRDRTVRLWDVTDPSKPRQLGAPLTGYADGVTTVVFSPDGRTLVTGGKDGVLHLWDVTDPARPHRLGSPVHGHDGPVHAVAFANFNGHAIDGNIMASSGEDRTVRLWDLTDRTAPRQLGQPLTGHQDRVWSVAFSSDGRTLASGSIDGTVRLWNATDLSHPHPLGAPIVGHPGGVFAVAFAPDTRTIASGGKDAAVRLWDVTDPSSPYPLGQPLTGHTSLVWALVFSPDGRTLASAAADNTVRLWNMTTRTAPRPLGEPLTGHGKWVTSLAFSPDGHTLASGSWDRTVRLWSTE